MVRLLTAVLAALWFVGAAAAAPLVSPCTQTGPTASECDPVNSSNALPVAPEQYPAGATAVTATNTGTTGSYATSLPAAAGKFTYICGFTIQATASAAATGTGNLSGIVSGTAVFGQAAGASPALAVQTQTFSPCIPSSAVNTAITLGTFAAGTGGVSETFLWGYQK